VRRSIFLALACAAIGFFAVSLLLPNSGGRTTGGWGAEFLGMSGLTLGAAGAGIGLAIGLALAFRRTRSPRARSPAPAPTAVETTGPNAQVRAWLRKKRRRDAPKRFGKRGN